MSRRWSCLVPFVLAVGCSKEPPPPIKAPVARPTPAPTHSAIVEASPPAPPPQPVKPVCEKLEVDVPDVSHVPFDVEVPAIVDDADAMAPFYEKLARFLRGKAKDNLRIGMYGDSNMTMDFLTGRMRRLLQQKYGDGGHGYVALGKPWDWYRHMDVKHDFAKKSWTAFAVSTAPAQDHLIDFAGIAVQSLGVGSTTWVETADPKTSPVGTSVSDLDVYYLERPNAGSFRISVDGIEEATIDAQGDAPVAAFHHFEVPDGPHKILIGTTTGKPVRLYGITMERKLDAPGIVVDSLGVGALSVWRQAEEEDAAISKATLAHRKYDLILDLVGTNMFNFDKFASWTKHVVEVHREALPDTPFLMMAPADMNFPSDKRVIKVGVEKKKLAAELGMPFWDFREAMGGEGAIHKFWQNKMAWSDLIHLTQDGANYMGDRVVKAIWSGFAAWLEKHPQAGCD